MPIRRWWPSSRSASRSTPDDVYEMTALLDYTTLFEIAALEIEPLRDPPWTPLPPIGLETPDGDIFSAIRAGDVLLHHPYDSFYASVERFIREAADDPLTVSIKMTVYRVGDDTPFVQSLIRAAEAGKQVACVIELNARFDEERNLHWSRELEKVGAHVVFGVTGLKTHSKAALVVRQEEGGIRCYAHVATGNYHARTARLYEDVGLLTADPAVTGDVVTLFHFLTGRSRTPSFTNLVVAPMHMRAAFTRLIEREISNHAAGQAGPDRLQDEPARGPGDLRPALTGLAGGRAGRPDRPRALQSRPGRARRDREHPRPLRRRPVPRAFADLPLRRRLGGPAGGHFLIGSADWMYRNLSERVEAAVPIVDRRLRARLWEILEVCLQDRRNAWQMQPDGSYVQLRPDPDDPVGAEGTHETMMRLALARHGYALSSTA